jgi:colicin import membrane protein
MYNNNFIPVSAPPAPQVKDAAIALERDKEQRRVQEEKAREALELERKEKALREAAAREAADKKAAEIKAAELRAVEIKAAEIKAAAIKAAELRAAEIKAAEQKAAEKLAAEAAERARRTLEAEEARRAEMREDQLKRIQGMVGATGRPTATGNATRSAGPSDSYGGRIRERVRPNIVFNEDVPGNPVAEVEVVMSPDGTIQSRKIIRSSGVRSWDEAVLRAVDKMVNVPRDTDGRIPEVLLQDGLEIKVTL